MQYIRLSIIFIIICCSCSTSKNIEKAQFAKSNDRVFFNKQEANIYYKEDGISLKFFNNEDFFHIIFETNNIKTIKKIEKLGLSIWIDPRGKGKSVFGVNFPLPVEKKNRECSIL